MCLGIGFVVHNCACVRTYVRVCSCARVHTCAYVRTCARVQLLDCLCFRFRWLPVFVSGSLSLVDGPGRRVRSMRWAG